MQSKKVIHRFIALLLSFFATLALAHPGHGGNGASHDLEHLIWMLDNVGWLPNRSGVDYSSVTTAKPQFSAFVDLPDDYVFFTLPSIEPINEILTRFAAKLTEAYADSSLVGNNAAMMAVLEESAAETNKILDRAGILGK